jgi:hypothetical protein
MNSLKHGGYATTPVIPRGPLAEDPAAHETFRSGVNASLHAEGPVEEELADRIASIMWRSRRPAAYEATYLAEGPGSRASLPPGHAEWIESWNSAAARVLRDPGGVYSAADYELGAVAAGHTVGLEMDDSWPQPKPTTPAAWNEFIEATLASGDKTREDAARYCDREIERVRPQRAKAEAEALAAEVTRIIDGDLLLKTSRVEAHLGRELTRHLTLLRVLQSDRAISGEDE